MFGNGCQHQEVVFKISDWVRFESCWIVCTDLSKIRSQCASALQAKLFSYLKVSSFSFFHDPLSFLIIYRYFSFVLDVKPNDLGSIKFIKVVPLAGLSDVEGPQYW